MNSDGMSDVWQSQYGIGPAEGLDDPDGDGEDNFRESYWGTNPGDPNANSRLYISSGPATNLDLSWLGIDQKDYQLETSAELSVWSNLLGIITGAGGTSSVMVAGDADYGFFRNHVLPDSDSDGDGLLDWEEGLLGSDPTGLDGDDDGIPDIYEFLKGTDAGDAMSSPAAAWYVSPVVPPGGNGSAGSPFNTIQAALNAAVEFDIIELADGVYTGTGNRSLGYLGKSVLVRSTNRADNCVIDCEDSARGFAFSGGENGLAILSGVTIRNGSASTGAGLRFTSSSSPTIWNCALIGNRAATDGGGAEIISSSPIFDGCLFLQNQAVGDDGGGLFISSTSQPLFRSCRILDNSAIDDGGAVFNASSTAAPRFEYCVISGNVCGDDGGAIYNSGASPTLINCSVVDNQSGPTTGGGLFNSSTLAQPVVLNCILWGNTPNQIQGGLPIVTYSDVQGGFAGTGNIDTNPFLTASYRLTSPSACIDAGSSIGAPPVDPDGEAPYDDPSHANVVSIVDMGADEFVDTDVDQLADVWELDHFGDLSPTAGDDADLDGLNELGEYEASSDPNDSDTDDDGLSDGDEVLVHGTSPLNADSDEDFMTDGQEITYGLDPLDASDQMEDPDGDRIPNLYEVVHGANPTNNLSVPLPTLHVDAAALPGGDGSAGTPFNAIQPALDAAVAYEIVQVADGVYTGTANRNLNFTGKPLMLHSTNGTENCVIDCQLGGRGFLFSSGEDRRSLVQGLTIRNGSNTSGGGMSILTSSSPLIRDCRIETCVATSVGGAGVQCTTSNPLFERCTISDNISNSFGGGVRMGSSGTPIFRSCRIVRNRATLNGGGVMIASSTAAPEFYSCVIGDNETGDDGGGLYNNGADPLLINCTVAGNRAGPSTGGGLFSNGGAPVLQNCIVWANVPDQIVGGAPVITYSAIQGGAAGTGNIPDDPLLTPLTFRLTAASPCIDAGTDTNTPPVDIDGELHVDDPAHSNAVSIVDIGADEFVDTDADQLADVWELEHFGDLSPTAGDDTDLDGLNELGEYEATGDPNDSDTDDDGLSDGDEVLVHGTSPTSEDTDADETPDGWEVAHGLDPLDPADRIEDADADRIPNLYEFVHGSDATNAASLPAATLYVDASAPPGGNGTSGNPFDTIQEGINAAVAYDIVEVADGQYTGAGNINLDFNGKVLLLLSESGASNCVIDCQGIGRGFSFADGEDDRSVVDGITVRNGSMSVGGGIDCNASSPTLRALVVVSNRSTSVSANTGGGGGIRCVNASPLIQQCTIVSNTAAGSGAGIFLVTSSSPRIESCWIEGNLSSNLTFGGGGILMSTGNPVVRKCTITDNTARGDGGGIYRLNTSSVIEDCVIAGNRSDDKGGGIYSSSSSGTIRDCSLSDNLAKDGGGMAMLSSNDRIENSALIQNAAERGGGMYHENSDPQILHTLFSMNEASNQGGGIYNDANSGPGIHNCILWGNFPNSINASPGTPLVSYSDVEGGWAGTGNLDADPLFTRHHRLRAASPCIDAGSNSNSLPLDIDGEARWDDPSHTNVISMVDIGWDEFVDTDADELADTWELNHYGDLTHTAGEDADAQGGPDGLSNLEEYEQNTDPHDADTDGDTLSDGDEVNTHGTDPLDTNTDDDRVDDNVEVAIGSDPLDPFDIKIENLAVSPFFFDPGAESGQIDFDLNVTGDVRIVFYPVLIDVHLQGIITVTMGTNPTRTLTALLPPGSNTMYWDGRDDATNLVAAGPYMFTIEATNDLGLVSATNDPRQTYAPYSPTITGGTVLNDGSVAFWMNQPAQIQYTLSAPAVVAMAPVIVPFPVVWGEVRDQGINIETWDGRGGTAVQGEGELYEPESWTLYAATMSLPDYTINVHYPANVISNMTVETYLILPRYAEVTEIRYTLLEDATTQVRVQDPDGNFISALDPVLQTAGAHSVEWHGGPESNTLVHAEGDYRVAVTAIGAVSQRTHEESANVTVRNR